MTDTDTPDATPNHDDAETTPDAPLNREQRRAQARGKKGGGAAVNPASPNNANPRVTGGRGPGAGGQVRYPRTGHK